MTVVMLLEYEYECSQRARELVPLQTTSMGKGMSRLTIFKEREEKMIHDMQERVLEQMELRDSGGTGLLRIC